MAAYGDVRTGSRCVFLLYAYLVFVTKFRHRVFTDAHLTSMEEEIMRDVCADFETQLAEFNGENGHVHLLVAFPPRSPYRAVNSLKGVSSRWMHQEFPELAAHYYRAGKLWSGSYFAGSVGCAPLSIVRQYIERRKPAGLAVVIPVRLTANRLFPPRPAGQSVSTPGES